MKKLQFFALLAIAVLFFSCENTQEAKEPYLSQTSLTLYVGNSESLILHNCEDYVSWSSDNKLIAEVSSNGLVTANLVGETIIRANGEECKVTVKPMHTCFDDPYLEWGSSESSVRSFMANLGYSLQKEEKAMLMYVGDNKAVSSYMYLFDNSGNLKGTGLALNNDYMDDIAEHLADRYILIEKDEDNYSFYFTDPEQKSYIQLQIYSSEVSMIAYVPVTSSKIKSLEQPTISMEIEKNPSEQKVEFEKLQTKIMRK